MFLVKSVSKKLKEFNDAGQEMKGKATLCSIDCRWVYSRVS